VNGSLPTTDLEALEDIRIAAAECRHYAVNADKAADLLEAQAAEERRRSRRYRAKADDFEAIAEAAERVEP